MAQEFNLLETIQNDSIQYERIFGNIDSFNKAVNSKNDLILHVNIRSLNANISKLQILIENLIIKPSIIVCTESWVLENYNSFALPDYDIYYNNSKINQNDGVMIYLSKYTNYDTEILDYDRIRILNSTIKLNNGNSLEISAIYRSHNISKTEFTYDLNKFLIKIKILKIT